MADLLFHLRLRRVRDLFLSGNIIDPAICITEESFSKISIEQSTAWKIVSKKIQNLSYTKEDEFWLDCAPFFQAVSEVPQLKRCQYEFMVLSKQIMHESAAVENSHTSKVLDVRTQMKREVTRNSRNICEPDLDVSSRAPSRIFSLAANAFQSGSKNVFALTDPRQLSSGTSTDLDVDVRRVLSVLQTYSASINFSGASRAGATAGAAFAVPKHQEATVLGNRRASSTRGVSSFSSSVNSTAVGSLSVRARDGITPATAAPASSVSDVLSEKGKGKGKGKGVASKRDHNGVAINNTANDGADKLSVAQPIILVGVTLRGREVRQSSASEDTPHGDYHAQVVVEGSLVHLGEYSTALQAARAHDRACMRALGPRQCSTEMLNFPIATYSRDSMELFTVHDEVLRRTLWGTAWAGSQDCDFSFLLTQQPKRNNPRAAEQQGNTDLLKPINESNVLELSPSKKSKVEQSAAMSNGEETVQLDVLGQYVPFSELVRYALPDFSDFVPEQNTDSDAGRRACAQSRNQRYWNFDAARETARCGDIIPVHCYILAQELLRSKSALAEASLPKPLNPDDVEWDPYSRPYSPREWESLASSRVTTVPSATHKSPARWERCLQKSAACQRELANLRTELRQALNTLEERQERLHEKRGGAVSRGVLYGVRQLSTIHEVFVCSVPENVMDPLSRLSGSQEIEFGCFSYAVEAALIREQILNPKGKAFGSGGSKKRVASNFSHDEWDALRTMSGQLAIFLKAHSKEKSKF